MNVVEKNVLEAIHYILEHNEFKFTDKQLSKADEYIIPFVGDLDIDEKEFRFITAGAPKLSYDRRIIPLFIRYFAYIEDNMGLYEELSNDGYIFYENHVIKFYALDRIMTGNFKKNEYKNLLIRYEDPISRFYFTLKGIDSEKKEKYAKDFSDIVRTDQTTLKVCNDVYGEDNHYNYLTRKNIEFFGKDFLLRMDGNRRNIINGIDFNISEEDALKIKELLVRYPDYKGIVKLSSELLNNFSVEEIDLMSKKDSILYKAAIKNNLLDRIKNILSMNPNFNCPKDFIREEIFRILSDEEIVELSDDAKMKISESIPNMQDVMVMPIKKIRGIVFRDKVLRKVDSIVGNRKK